MSEVKDWNTNANFNTLAPPDGAPENTTKLNQLNNIIREMQAAIARLHKDTSGSSVVFKRADNTNAYTCTLNQSLSNYYDGLIVRGQSDKPNDQTGLTTLSINGLPAKYCNYPNSQTLRPYEMTGATSTFIYKQWADAFFLISCPAIEQQPPIGSMMLFWAETAPLFWTQDTNAFWVERVVMTTPLNGGGAGGSWLVSGITDVQGIHNHGGGGTTTGAVSGPLGVQTGSVPGVSQDHTHQVSLAPDGLHQHNVTLDAFWRPLYSAWIVCIRSQ